MQQLPQGSAFGLMTPRQQFNRQPNQMVSNPAMAQPSLFQSYHPLQQHPHQLQALPQGNGTGMTIMPPQLNRPLNLMMGNYLMGQPVLWQLNPYQSQPYQSYPPLMQQLPQGNGIEISTVPQQPSRPPTQIIGNGMMVPPNPSQSTLLQTCPPHVQPQQVIRAPNQSEANHVALQPIPWLPGQLQSNPVTLQQQMLRQGNAQERKVIWQGELQWEESAQMPEKTQHTIRCSVTSAVEGGKAEVGLDKWPRKVVLKLIPLIQSVGDELLKDMRPVTFHPEPSESLESLTHMLSNGLMGCVFCADEGDCEIKMLVLVYCQEKKKFQGFIPKEQQKVINHFRKMMV
jgi:hypothetical protein